MWLISGLIVELCLLFEEEVRHNNDVLIMIFYKLKSYLPL